MMITQTLVSIIIPVYNAEKYLLRCVKSIFVQTYPNFELLLINDGSTDGSKELCDSLLLKDNRIKVFHKQNGGASSARNYGLDKATGKYICFVDADDWVDPNYIETLLPVNDEEMVVCSIRYEGVVRKPLIISERNRDRACIESTLHQMIEHMAICSPCCKILCRDIIERNDIRFDTNISAGEDMLFVYDYFSSGLNNIRTISEPLYHYYAADSTSLSHRIVDFATTEYVLDSIKKHVNNLSIVYNWNYEEGYKRLVWTQFNNLMAYVKNISSLSMRLRFLKKTLDNCHIRTLLSDGEFVIKRMRLNTLSALAYRITLFPLKLYYLFK